MQFKAAFLLIAFSLNTMIGFSCAVGLDMGFNSQHHHEAINTETSGHHSIADHHLHKNHQDQHQPGDADNCCHDKVSKIAQLDKLVPDAFSISVNYSFLSAPFFNDMVSLPSFRNGAIKYFIRIHHPPIPDIRIAIQSFQI